MTTVEVFAPAKINLTLHVTGQRPDGYHTVDSLVVFAQAGDRLVITPSDERRLTVTGPFAAGVPTGPENLVWKAVDLLGPEAFDIALTKNLPHGAGIGGGSSDAGAVLRAASALLKRPIPDPGTLACVGADLPVCALAQTVRMQGIGEILSPVPDVPPVALVLVNSGVPVPTGAVFAGLEHRKNPPMDAPTWSGLPSFLGWLGAQRNDLEPAACALEPSIGHTLDTLRGAAGCDLARMSGSGGTCWGLFRQPAAAQSAAQVIAKDHPDWWVQPTLLIN